LVTILFYRAGNERVFEDISDHRRKREIRLCLFGVKAFFSVDIKKLVKQNIDFCFIF